MAQEDTNVIDQPEVLKPKMVTVEIAGKKYDVPEGITLIKALWYIRPGSGAGSGLSWRLLWSLRHILSDQGRSKSEDLFGLSDGGPRRHVLLHDAAVSCT